MSEQDPRVVPVEMSEAEKQRRLAQVKLDQDTMQAAANSVAEATRLREAQHAEQMARPLSHDVIDGVPEHLRPQ